MVKTIINEEVILSYPDGFEEMDRAQLKMRTSLNRSSYKCGGFERKKVSGRNANGFTYEYILEDTEQIGEVLVFQNVNCFYMLYAYALKKNQKAARVVIDAIENSISFTNDKKEQILAKGGKCDGTFFPEK